MTKNYGRIEKEFQPLTEYNGVLFNLYLQHMRGMAKANDHFFQIKQFKIWLETRNIPQITSWSHIREQSQLFHEVYPYQIFRGRPFVRIGNLLSDLGALPRNYEERADQIANQMGRISADLKSTIEKYVSMMRKRRCSNRTIQLTIAELANLFSWLNERGSTDPFTVTVPIAEDYLTYLKAKRRCKNSYLLSIQYTLRRFYKWCRLERLTLANPWLISQIRRSPSTITICTETQFKKLCTFIRSPASDPEGALVLCLVLFFGLTKDDLRFATIMIEDGRLVIVLRRPPRTCGKLYYNRPEKIKLPEDSAWCRVLQRRFLASWRQCFQTSLNPLKLPLLLLPKYRCSVKPCGREKVRELVLMLTERATNTPISIRMLRQTCGHIHSVKGDASILASLGWSKITAFRYSWMPRIYNQSGSSK